jgi:hypothetical protein
MGTEKIIQGRCVTGQDIALIRCYRATHGLRVREGALERRPASGQFLRASVVHRRAVMALAGLDQSEFTVNQ